MANRGIYNSNGHGKIIAPLGVAILIHKLWFLQSIKSCQMKKGDVFVSGYLHGESVLLASVYAPNTYEPSFYYKLLADIFSFSTSLTIIGGDFNCALDLVVGGSGGLRFWPPGWSRASWLLQVSGFPPAGVTGSLSLGGCRSDLWGEALGVQGLRLPGWGCAREYVGSYLLKQEILLNEMGPSSSPVSY
uniref:Endonuclease/exonuclease/phosphatase domain-containing protein n=1 Tax=Paramormyrops kingsleyae TaxID=1676925 RepID=A0A3B3SND7_9TELE